MSVLFVGTVSVVHCRIGSLEIKKARKLLSRLVHCRIGSLEKSEKQSYYIRAVHCRIGSLEMGNPI